MSLVCSGQVGRQRAKELLAEAYDIYQDLGDQWLGANILLDAAWENFRHGYPRKGRAMLEELVTAQRATNIKINLLGYIGSLWYLSLQLGDFPAARAYAQENLEIRRSIAIPMEEAWGNVELGRLEMALGDLGQARHNLETALRTFRKLQNKANTSRTLNYLGFTALYEGNLESGLALLEESRDICSSFEDALDECILDNLFYLGQAALRRGDHTRAAELICDSLQRVWKSGNLPWISPRLEGLAACALGVGHYAFSATLLGAADQQRRQMETPIFPVDQPAYEQVLSSLRAMTNEDAFNEAWKQGEAMSLAEVVAFALARQDD